MQEDYESLLGAYQSHSNVIVISQCDVLRRLFAVSLFRPVAADGLVLPWTKPSNVERYCTSPNSLNHQHSNRHPILQNLCLCPVYYCLLVAFFSARLCNLSFLSRSCVICSCSLSNLACAELLFITASRASSFCLFSS